jgi:hypothetical protein
MDQGKINELTTIANTLKTLLRQATQGQWTEGPARAADYTSHIHAGDALVCDVARTNPPEQGPANTRFMTHAQRTSSKLADGALELIAEVQRLEKELTETRAQLVLALGQAKRVQDVGR